MSQNGNKCLTKEVEIIEAEELFLVTPFAQNSLFSYVVLLHLPAKLSALMAGLIFSLFLPLLCSHRILFYFRALTTCMQKDYLGIHEQQNLNSLRGRNKPSPYLCAFAALDM